MTATTSQQRQAVANFDVSPYAERGPQIFRLKVMLFARVSDHRGGDRIYEMRCLFVAVGLNARFIVLHHWAKGMF